MIVTILGLVVAFFVVFYRNEIFWFFNAQKYLKQGVAMRYHPVLGYMKFLNTPGREDGDGLINWRRAFKKKGDPTKSEPVIVTNGVGSDPILFINGEKLAKEWFANRSKFSMPMNIANLPFQESYFYKDNKTAEFQRGIASKLFLIDSMRKLSPAVIKIIKRNLQNIKRKVLERSQNGEFVDLSAEENIRQITAEVVGYVMIGGEAPTFDGVSISKHLAEITKDYFVHSMTDFWHKVTGGLTSRLGLSAEYNRIRRIHDGCLREIEKLVHHRTHSKDYVLGLNMLDIIIEHNKKVQAEGHPEKAFKPEEILDNIVMFFFAGVETSITFARNCIYMLGQQQKYQAELREQVRKDIFSGEDLYDDYICSPYMDDFITECFRVLGPVNANLYARSYKNFKLGDLKVYKGTGIMLSVYTIQKKPENFDDPLEFDLKKYEDQKKIKDMKKGLLVPFGGGKRDCAGRNLAMMSIKILVANLVNMFEIKPSSTPIYTHATITVAVSHTNTKLRVLE